MAKNPLKTYKVIWEIDIDASSTKKAAELAREIQLDPDSIATFFLVEDGNGKVVGRHWITKFKKED